jgi:hypothetical protein
MAQPTIDVTSFRGKLDEDFKNGKISPREYRRLQTGMGNISNGQNQGYSYQIDPGSRTFSAEKNGTPAKGKAGGITTLNPITGRKTSKAITYINANQNKASAGVQAPAPTNDEIGAGTVAETATASNKPIGAGNVTRVGAKPTLKAPRYEMPNNPTATVGGPVRVDPANARMKSFENPSFSSNASRVGNSFSFAPRGTAQAKTETPQAPPKASDAPQPAKPTVPLVPAVTQEKQFMPPPPPPENPVKIPTQQATPDRDEGYYSRQIEDFYNRIGVGKRQPGNRVYSDDRRNGSYYQSKIEELKAEYFKKFGRNYGGVIGKNGRYDAPGQHEKFDDGGKFKQSGREIDINSVLNTGMGIYGLTSGLMNKSPSVPIPSKAIFRNRSASGDYDSLQRNLSAGDSNYASMRNTLRDNAGSDRTTYIRGLLGAGQFRNQANQQAYSADSAIRIQDRQREDYTKLAEDQFNAQNKNQYFQQKFNWDATRWQSRAQGAQGMLNSSLQFGVDDRANKYNNGMAEKQANKQLDYMEAGLRTQLILDFKRNNGGRGPTDAELDEMIKQIVPNKDNPRIFS